MNFSQTKPNTMQPHQQRVIDEKTELDAKLTKLREFFNTDLYAGLSPEEQSRLHRQASAMNDYSEVLGERIGAFPK